MAGKAVAVANGKELVTEVMQLCKNIGLDARAEVKVGRRIWGSERRIDVVITDPQSRKRLGVECKFQGTSGSAEEKIPTTIQDIKVWPIPGIVVFSGDGFSATMRTFLISTGMAVEVVDLESWLRLFFGLDIA